MDLKNYSQRKISESKNFLSNYKKTWQDKMIEKYLKNGSKVLDIGSGPCGFVEKFNDIKIKYYGVDYNKYFVDYGIEKGHEIKKCDLLNESIPFEDNSFDLIYCRHLIEHLPTDRQIFLFSEVSRLLKKGGILVLLGPTAYHWYFWDDPTHYRPCTHGQFGHLSDDFDLEIIELKYSKLRFFSNSLQKWLRLPPLRWFLWEVYLVAKKK